MKFYDATFSSAMFVGSFIITASIMADIHYHTFANLFGIVNYVMYPFGLLVLMVGLWLLVQQQTIDEQEEPGKKLVNREKSVENYTERTVRLSYICFGST